MHSIAQDTESPLLVELLSNLNGENVKVFGRFSAWPLLNELG